MPKRILVVDDDPTSLKFTASTLTPLGYQIKTAAHAEDIESVARSFQPDCIIMDLIMPEVDGNQAVQRLQQDKALNRIPVIFLTGVNMRDDERGIEFEINVGNKNYRTLIKPIDAKKLSAEIEAAI